MATQLTLVNNILRRLREDTVTSVADNAYAQLVAMWLNDGIRDVSEAYDWSSLRHTINVAVAATTTTYDLSLLVSGGGNVDNADRVTTEGSLVRFDMYGRPLCFVYDDDTSTDVNVQLRLIDEDTRIQREALDTDQDDDDPYFFSLAHTTTGDGFQITVYPIPALTRHLRITFTTPQAELAIDGTDDDTEVIVPRACVEAYVHLHAANERGEEIGEPGNMLERRYQNVLGGAIEAAMQADIRTNKYESVRG